MKINSLINYSIKTAPLKSFKTQRKVPNFCSNIDKEWELHKQYIDGISKKLKDSKLAEGELMSLYETQRINRDDVTYIAFYSDTAFPKKDMDYFIDKKIPLTLRDDANIVLTRYENKHTEPVKTTDKLFIDNHEKILQHEMQALEKVPQEGKMLIITGHSGSGKSTYLNSINNDEYYVADIDEIKKLFPEYETRKKDNSLHNCSRSILQEEIIPEAIKQRRNIAIPTTGLSEYIVRLATPAKENGYNVKLAHVKVDPNLAMLRVARRYDLEGRFVDPYFITIRKPFLDSQIADFENSDLVDEIEIIEN